MGRGGNRQGRMSTLSWVIFRPKTNFFRNFFEVNFLCENFMDFYGFWMDFGRVLGGQNGGKIDIFDIFGGMVVETLFLVNFCLIFEKIDDENIWNFNCLLIGCFIICLFNSMLFFMFETLKNIVFS